MTELVTHSPIAALIPGEREKRLKRMERIWEGIVLKFYFPFLIL